MCFKCSSDVLSCRLNLVCVYTSFWNIAILMVNCFMLSENWFKMAISFSRISMYITLWRNVVSCKLQKIFLICVETHFYWVLSIYGFLEGICKFQKLLSQTWNRKSWSWVCVTNRCKHKPDLISMKAHTTNFPNTHKSFKAQYSFICKRISI